MSVSSYSFNENTTSGKIKVTVKKKNINSGKIKSYGVAKRICHCDYIQLLVVSEKPLIKYLYVYVRCVKTIRELTDEEIKIDNAHKKIIREILDATKKNEIIQHYKSKKGDYRRCKTDDYFSDKPSKSSKSDKSESSKYSDDIDLSDGSIKVIRRIHSVVNYMIYVYKCVY